MLYQFDQRGRHLQTLNALTGLGVGLDVQVTNTWEIARGDIWDLLGIKVILEGFKFKRPKIVIDSQKHRRFLIFAVFYFIFSVAHAWYLTGGGSLYQPGAKYQSYVSATNRLLKFKKTDPRQPQFDSKTNDFQVYLT